MNNKLKGTIAGVVAAVCYGTNPLGAKFLYADGINTNTVLTHRFGFAMIILGIVMIMKKMSFKVSKRELGILMTLGVLFAASSMTLYSSFLHIDAGIASTLLFVYPMMVALIMTVCFKEKMTWVTVGSILLAFAGIFMLNGANGEGTLNATGVILVMVSSLTYAIYIVVVNKTRIEMSSIKLTFYVLLFCVSCIIIHSFFRPETHLMLLKTPRQYGFALMLSIVPTIMSLILMTISIRDIGSTPSAILGALEPLTAVVIGIFVFNEAFTLRLAGGIALILSGVLLIILGKQNNSSQQSSS